MTAYDPAFSSANVPEGMTSRPRPSEPTGIPGSEAPPNAKVMLPVGEGTPGAPRSSALSVTAWPYMGASGAAATYVPAMTLPTVIKNVAALGRVLASPL